MDYLISFRLLGARDLQGWSIFSHAFQPSRMQIEQQVRPPLATAVTGRGTDLGKQTTPAVNPSVRKVKWQAGSCREDALSLMEDSSHFAGMQAYRSRPSSRLHGPRLMHTTANPGSDAIARAKMLSRIMAPSFATHIPPLHRYLSLGMNLTEYFSFRFCVGGFFACEID